MTMEEKQLTSGQDAHAMPPFLQLLGSSPGGHVLPGTKDADVSMPVFWELSV